MQTRISSILLLLLVANSLSTQPQQQNCPGCAPPRSKPGVQGSYTAVLGPGFDDTQRVLAQAGADYWNNAMLDRIYAPGIDVVSSGTGQIELVLDPTLPPTTGAEDRTDGLGRGQIAFNPNYLNNFALMEHLFGHELGHALGFGTSGCDPADSKMVASVAPNGPFTGGSYTCADKPVSIAITTGTRAQL